MKNLGFGLLTLSMGAAAYANTPLPDFPPVSEGQHVVINIPQQRLFLYTDGVNEAMNAEGDVYSNEAMFRALASSPSREPASVLRHMLDDVSVHVNGNTASDDMTILCVRYFGGKR